MKKLSIRKETLIHLSSEQADQVAGGMRDTWTCPPYTGTCPPTTPYRGCDTVKTDCCDL